MAYAIVARSGPQQGQSMTLRPGMRLGRTGEIRLDDPKASSFHAEVVDDAGVLKLRDLKSKNALRVNNKKTLEIALEVGLVVQIGSYEYEVVPAPPEASGVSLSVSGSIENETVVRPVEEPKPIDQARPETFTDYLKEKLRLIKNQPRAIVALPQTLKMTFIAGLQAETEWRISYAPRFCGAKSLDLRLFESGAPDICFEIVPTPQGIALKTNHPDVVTVNGRAATTHRLENGDVISILNSRIEVQFDS